MNNQEEVEKVKSYSVHGMGPLEKYRENPVSLEDWELTEVLDNILMVQFADIEGEDGENVIRDGILVPLNSTSHRMWRVAKVLLSGPDCNRVKKDDYIMFAGDKGIPAVKVNNKKNVLFISEDKIFGIVQPKDK